MHVTATRQNGLHWHILCSGPNRSRFVARTIALPPLDTLIDISSAHLAQMENDMQQNPEEDDTEAHLVDPKNLDDD